MYRESRRYCRACRRQTVHWRPWGDWQGTQQPEGLVGLLAGMASFLRRLGRTRWRCLECDHPWDASLLYHPPNSGDGPSPAARG